MGSNLSDVHRGWATEDHYDDVMMMKKCVTLQYYYVLAMYRCEYNKMLANS